MFRFVWFLFPLSALTHGLWQAGFITFYIFLFFYRRIKIPLIFIYCVLVMIIIFIFQIYFNSLYPVSIFSGVVDSSLRSHGTMGTYYADGSTNFVLLFKFFVYLFITLLISKSFSSINLFVSFLYRLFIFVFLLNLVFFFILFIDSSYDLLKFLARQNVGTGNFLVSDDFGYRISAGFTEPSLMSSFAGTLAGVIFKYLGRDRKIFIFFAIFIIFLVSRSLSIFIVFFSVHLIYCYFSIFCLGSPPFLMLIFLFFKDDVFNGKLSFLFRSSNERLHLPVFDYSWSHILFGIDFGQVYAFLPGVNHLLQYGVFGFLVFYLMFKFDLKTFLIYLCISFVIPQFWFPSQWICLGLILARKNLELKS
jgi:hypothetical protein